MDGDAPFFVVVADIVGFDEVEPGAADEYRSSVFCGRYRDSSASSRGAFCAASEEAFAIRCYAKQATTWRP